MLLGSVLGYLGGLAVGGADAFWNYFQNKDKDINTAYVFRSTFLEENYWAYKYTDAYYENQNKTGLIQITSREWWV